MLNQHAVCALSAQKIWAHLGTHSSLLLGRMVFPIPKCAFSFQPRSQEAAGSHQMHFFKLHQEHKGPPRTQARPRGIVSFYFQGEHV